MANTTLADVGAVLRFHLDSERGKDLRRKRQILIGRSLQTFSNNLRILHRREMLAKIDLKISQMAQIETTLSTTEKYFRLGEQRILAVVFLLLLAPEGSRPDSILKIRLSNLRLVLYQPVKKGQEERPPQLIIYIRLEYTKTYRGQKDVYVCARMYSYADPSP